MFDYQKISSDLVKDLPERTRDIINRRFGLSKNLLSALSDSVRMEREPLEKIGKDYGITRERVRQIENDGLKKIKKKAGSYGKVFRDFEKKIDEFGGFKKEDIFLASLGKGGKANHVFFLLNIGDSFFRFSENENFYSFWTKDPKNLDYAEKVVGAFYDVLEKEKRPLALRECDSLVSFATDQKFISSIELSKNIYQNKEGLLGLKSWPEINPRGIKDKAYSVLKKEEKPLHFTSITELIGQSALSQTVHNELIKDPRFVLVGRGIYALGEWGYQPGEVKDVIIDIFKKSKKPLSKEEIIERVLRKRIVKRNTVLQNLSNKKYFSRNFEGKYIVNEE